MLTEYFMSVMKMELAKQLSYNYIFRGLSREVVAGLAAMALERRYQGGDVLVRQFESSTDLFIIMEGTARIKDYRGDTVAEFGPGSVVGEMSLIDEDTRSATVVAAGPVSVAVIPASVLKGMMESDPEIKGTIMGNLSKVLCRRLRTTNDHISRMREGSLVAS